MFDKNLLKIIEELDTKLQKKKGEIATLADFILYGDNEGKVDSEFLEILEGILKADLENIK